VFDPELISYRQLLDIFWAGHDPTSQPWTRQYRNIIFYNSEKQRRAAEKSKEELASSMKHEITTDIIPFTAFYQAEDYHQKYMLRNSTVLMKELLDSYPDVKDLVLSTSAARVNGYLGGNGTCEQIKQEIGSLGLSETGRKVLMREVCGRSAGKSCPAGRCGR